MSIQIECHSNWNVTQNGISLKMECHPKLNVNKIGMSVKLECHSNWNVTEKVVNPMTSKSASLG